MTSQSKSTKTSKTTTPSKEKTMHHTTKKTTATSATSTAVPNLGLAPLVAKLSSALDAAEAGLGPEAPATTASEKRHTGKARKGSDKAVALIAPIVQQHGLDSPSLSAAQMMAHHAKAQTLLTMQARLQKTSKRVGDETFGAQTTAWDMALQFYALLQRRAKTDGTVAEAIAPVAHLFSYRHPSTKEGKPTKVQTRVRVKLKDATALAQRHDVTIEAPQLPVPAATSVQSAPIPAAPPAVAPAPVIAAAPPAVTPAPTVVAAPVAVAPPSAVTPPPAITPPAAIVAAVPAPASTTVPATAPPTPGASAGVPAVTNGVAPTGAPATGSALAPVNATNGAGH